MRKEIIIVNMLILLVCVGLNRFLGVGFLIFAGTLWFSAKNLYDVARKTT